MATPSSSDARLFYRCAIRRFEEAQILLRAERTTGAVYLAGYGIECTLKSLVLSAAPASQTSSILGSFRGQRAHGYEWLREQYYGYKGARLPPDVNHHLTLASYWSTNLRYMPGDLKRGEAEDFIEAVAEIIEWARGRL